MSITLTNPEHYPTGEDFRVGVVAGAHRFYNLTAAIEDDETQTRDEVLTVLTVRAIKAADVAIAVMQVSYDADAYTFFTIKGADLLHAAMMTPDKPAAFTMASFPVFRPEDATELRNHCGDGAGLQ